MRGNRYVSSGAGAAGSHPECQKWEAKNTPSVRQLTQPRARPVVSRGRDAQFRPVRLNAAPLAGAARWLGDYRRFWEESFDQLDEYVKDLMQKEKNHDHSRKRK